MTLFASADNAQDLWTRLMKECLAVAGNQEWRVVDSSFLQNLTPNQKNELGVSEINIRSCIQELIRLIGQESAPLQNLVFNSDLWNENDLEQVVAGIYGDNATPQQQRIAILRRLPLHIRLSGNQRERIAIADDQNGQTLKPDTLLENNQFANDFQHQNLVDYQDAIQNAWELLQAKITLIARYPAGSNAATAQNQLFTEENPNNANQPIFHEVSWREVIAVILQQDNPEPFSQLVLAGLTVKQAGVVGRELTKKLREARMWVDKNSKVFCLNDLMHLEGMEDSLANVFENTDFRTLNDLPIELKDHPGFEGYHGTLLPPFSQVLQQIAEICANNEKWTLGIGANFLPANANNDYAGLLDFLNHVKDCHELSLANIILMLHQRKGDMTPTNFFDKIRSSVTRLWNINTQGIQRRIDTLNYLREHARIQDHDGYLKQFVAEGEIFSNHILPAIQLRNIAGTWCNTNLLIWQNAGADPQYVLHNEHQKILIPNEDNLVQEIHPEANAQQQVPIAPNEPDKSAQALITYLETFRNQNGLPRPEYPLMAASFIAVCYDHTVLRKFAEDCLRNQVVIPNFDALRDLLFNVGAGYDFRANNNWANGHFLFEIHPANQNQATYQNILGQPIQVPLNVNPSHLLVDDVNIAKVQATYNGQPIRKIKLRQFAQIDGIEKINSKWGITLKTIVAKGYGLTRTETPSILENFEKIIAPDAEIKTTRLYLLDSAESRMGELGCRNNPIFAKILNSFRIARDARIARQQFEQQGDKNSETPEAKRKEAEQHLSDAHQSLITALTAQREIPLSDNNQIEDALCEALRRKIKELGYTPNAVLFELFQNADDALSERLAIQGQDTNIPKTLKIKWNLQNGATDGTLHLLHWGRPINSALGLLENDLRYQSYRQDLVKMLNLHTSDKNQANDDGNNLAITTGKFGLGFKTVFLLSKAPSIMSGRLQHRIRGAWMPNGITNESLERMNTLRRENSCPNDLTLFELSAVSQESISPIIEKFKQSASYLILFSKSLEKIEIDNNGRNQPFAKILSEPNCNWSVSSNKWVLYPNPQTVSSAGWVFELDGNGVTVRPEDIPPVWTTVPTHENSAIRCAINGDWHMDTGRLRIARQSSEQMEQVAKRLATCLQTAVHDLQDNAKWEAFYKKAGWQGTDLLSRYSFWKSLWVLFSKPNPVQDWKACIEKSDTDIISAILWNTDFGAYRELIVKHKIVPSGIEDIADYRVLTQIQIGEGNNQNDQTIYADFYLEGLLDAKADLKQAILSEAQFRNSYPPTTVVSQSVGKYVNELVNVGQRLKPLQVKEVVREFVKDNRVEPNDADSLGIIFTFERLKDWKKTHGDKVDELEQVFHHFEFNNQLGNPVQAKDLIVGARNGFEGANYQDEQMRAAFAPDSALLHSDYNTPEAIQFFLLCRESMEANAVKLAEWACDTQGDKLTKVFEYLVKGKLREELAQEIKEIQNDWFQNIKVSQEFVELTDEMKFKVRQLFEPINYQAINQNIDPPPPPPPPPIEKLITWWERNNNTAPYTLTGDWWDLITRNFNDAIGIGNDENSRKDYLVKKLESPQSDESKLLWFRVLSIANFISEGRRMTEVRDYMKNDTFFQKLWKARNTQELNHIAESVFAELVDRRHIHDQAQGERSYFWRRVFYDMRKINRIVFEYQFAESLLQLHVSPITEILRFVRGGADQNPIQTLRWTGVMGQSAAGSLLFVIRELRRLGIFTPPDDKHCYFVCKPVRNAAIRFGLLDERHREIQGEVLLDASAELHDRISKLPEEHRQIFKNLYDIPLLHWGINND